jgi:hypothetical protein
MTDQPATPAPADANQIAERRSTRQEIASAIDLGWRVAALYALSPTTLKAPSPISDDMLLNRRSLSASDRVDLEVRAIAGSAVRVGVALEQPALDSLLALASRSGASADGEQAFRDALEARHIEFDKRLWAADEASGKAYELGNFLSDTWNRVLRPRVKPDPHSELLEIFSPMRVQRMKLLLDDLQARVDPVAAHTVEAHLGQWRDRVAATPMEAARASAEGLEPEAVVKLLEPVERQTIIWRQMLTGDKEPESWIGNSRRSEVRDEFLQQLWNRYRRRLTWILPLVAVLGAAAAVFYPGNEDYVRGLLGSALALAGTVGLTRASMTSTLKRGLQQWGDLMWNRALAQVICRETSMLDELFPAPEPASGRGRRRRRSRG